MAAQVRTNPGQDLGVPVFPVPHPLCPLLASGGFGRLRFVANGQSFLSWYLDELEANSQELLRLSMSTSGTLFKQGWDLVLQRLFMFGPEKVISFLFPDLLQPKQLGIAF